MILLTVNILKDCDITVCDVIHETSRETSVRSVNDWEQLLPFPVLYLVTNLIHKEQLFCFLSLSHLYIESFKSLVQNTTGKKSSWSTANTQTYHIHSFYINTKTYQQINVLHFKYTYISTDQLHVYTKRKREVHTN